MFRTLIQAASAALEMEDSLPEESNTMKRKKRKVRKEDARLVSPIVTIQTPQLEWKGVTHVSRPMRVLWGLTSMNLWVELTKEPRALWSVVSLAKSAAFVAYEASSIACSTADSTAYAVSALASALEACSPEMEASRLASLEASAATVTAPRRALATLVSTSSGVILAAMSRECWSTTVLRP